MVPSVSSEQVWFGHLLAMLHAASFEKTEHGPLS